jgi:H+-transporting ATPase
MNATVADEGLSSAEARARLSKYGPNSIADVEVRPFRRILEKFSAPVPWLLEATVLLELVLGKYFEAAVILALLIFNAAIGFFQESRAQATLAALKSRLSLTASVRRDRVWMTIPAAELVPGDVIKLSLGGVVAADVRISGGDVLLDQSMLTGESVPIGAGADRRSHKESPRRQFTAISRVSGGSKSCRVQRGAHPIHAGLCNLDEHAVKRSDLAGADGGFGVHSGGTPGDIHTGRRPGCARSRQAGRITHTSLRCR